MKRIIYYRLATKLDKLACVSGNVRLIYEAVSDKGVASLILDRQAHGYLRVIMYSDC